MATFLAIIRQGGGRWVPLWCQTVFESFPNYIVHLVFVSFGYVFITSDNVLGIWYLVGRRDDLALN